MGGWKGRAGESEGAEGALRLVGHHMNEWMEDLAMHAERHRRPMQRTADAPSATQPFRVAEKFFKRDGKRPIQGLTDAQRADVLDFDECAAAAETCVAVSPPHILT